MITTLIQTVAVLVILAVMVMILLSIGHLFSGDFNTHEEDEQTLREEVDTRREVITGRSLFSNFMPERVASREKYVEKHRK